MTESSSSRNVRNKWEVAHLDRFKKNTLTIEVDMKEIAGRTLVMWILRTVRIHKGISEPFKAGIDNDNKLGRLCD